jgi:hypothetical protein
MRHRKDPEEARREERALDWCNECGESVSYRQCDSHVSPDDVEQEWLRVPEEKPARLKRQRQPKS